MAIALKENHYLVILCGGTGPRLWPLSRANNPKQFLPLFDKDTLLEQTIKRSVKIVPKSNVYVVTNKNFYEKTKKISQKHIPAQNVISEPLKKNTTLAIVYITAIISKHNPNAVITTLPSDHYIKNLDRFKRDIIKTKTVSLKNESILTIGIKPTSPNPSYGYILPGKKLTHCFKVSKFIEKPDTNKASVLIKKGKALWNSGIYTFPIKVLVEELKKLQPGYYDNYLAFQSCLNNHSKIEDVYLNALDLAIDRSISEKSDRLMVISATFKWSDVGQWNAIFINSNKDKNRHAVIDKKTLFTTLKSSNCLVSGQEGKLIGLVGVNNLAIIDSPDALLVCNLDDSFSVRDLVGLIVNNKKTASYFLSQK